MVKSKEVAEMSPLQTAIKAEQLSLLFKAMASSSFAATINAAILTFMLWDVIRHDYLIGWLTVLLLATFGRLLLSHFYQRDQAKVENSHRWGSYFSAGTILAGICWGSASLLLFASQSVVHQVFLAFVVGGMGAGAITSLSPQKLPILTFLSLTVLPLSLRFVIEATPMAYAMGFMLFLFWIILVISSLRIHHNFTQNISLRLESQRQRDELEKSENRFRELFENNRCVELIIDPDDGAIIAANRAAEAFYGYSLDQLLTMTISDINMLSHAEVAAEMQQAKSEGRNHFIFQHRLASGEERDVEVYSGPLHWNGKKVLYSIIHDITARVKAEDQLRKLSQAIEQAGESIVITDREGIIEYVNPAFSLITGHAAEDVMGESPRLLKSGRQSLAFYEELWQTILSGEVWKRTLIERRKDGSLYPASMSIAPIFNEEHEITHFVGIQQDMSDHQELENKFRQAQKMEAIGTLVGGIAHDFNNMLGGMTGNLYLAKKRMGDFPDVVHRLEVVESLSYRASDMIKQLLMFARKGVLEMRPFGLTSFIKEVSKINEVSIPENITFKTHFCQEELVVNGDATQLHQALINLLNNARDAVAKVAEPQVSLSLDEFEADAAFKHLYPSMSGTLFARLTVSDNGCGINKEEQEHIFEPFYTSKEVGTGTGLGLAMVYGAIESHGGIVDVESSPGEGSSFYIYLPLLEEKQSVTSPEDSDAIISGRGETILVVDDNADIRKSTKEVLESIGYKVLEASDGLEAVEIFAASHRSIACVLMDVVMPRLGGVKAVERMCTIDPDVNVIFTTGYDKEDALKGEMPSADYLILSKPCHIEMLSRVIREQLDG
ncbi:PAS domain-containing sensor histidine kinase [Mariprofundus sp. KV]|uniref:hybrid sensor histidine kinase/response regulator n=1 Tax=Mariprofundus sp. KV TaxID=2608715 RepID=UPI001F509436|nr:PAS domain-containing sensor histidine kinase [Mariprofundus sp. KV]